MFDSDGMLRKPDPDSSSKIATNGPFFTVMVPTMNRPNLLKAAIHSVMWQSFPDFELIVSDNSNDEASRTKNQATIEEYVKDPRVRYIHPARWMNMPDHWEFATRHATGRYVVILTDRFVMRPSALEFLHSQINKYPSKYRVVSWYDQSTFNEQSGILINGDFRAETAIFDSKELVRNYARFNVGNATNLWSNRLPRSLNSCYRFDVAQTIRNKHGRLFIPIAPDYTAAFLLLAYTDTIFYLDRPLFINHGDQSNGYNFLVYDDTAFISTLEGVNIFEGVPLRINTAYNFIMRDLLKVKSIVDPEFFDVSPDLVGYYLLNYCELQHRERLGSLTDINAYYTHWWNGVGKLTPDQQKKIKEGVKELDQQRVSLIGLRRLVVRIGLAPFYHLVMAKLRYVRQRLAGKPIYPNVFEAAKQTDYILTNTFEKTTL